MKKKKKAFSKKLTKREKLLIFLEEARLRFQDSLDNNFNKIKAQDAKAIIETIALLWKHEERLSHEDLEIEYEKQEIVQSRAELIKEAFKGDWLDD